MALQRLGTPGHAVLLRSCTQILGLVCLSILISEGELQLQNKPMHAKRVLGLA